MIALSYGNRRHILREYHDMLALGNGVGVQEQDWIW